MFRVKRLPQSTQLVPRAGILLLKETTVYTPVGAAEFRSEEIPFDQIMKTVRTISSKLMIHEKVAMINSWDRVREKLDRTTRNRPYLKKMDLTTLPTLVEEDLPPLMDALIEPLDDLVNVIRGNTRDEAVEEGSVEEIIENVDVVVYTKTRSKARF